MFDVWYAQLVFLGPAIIALTDYVKTEWEARHGSDSFASWATLLTAGAWGMVLSLVWTYYDSMPEPVQVALAGLSVALVAAGVVKSIDYAKK